MRNSDRQQFESANVFGTSEPNLAHSEFFTGSSFLSLSADPQAGELSYDVRTGVPQQLADPPRRHG